MGQKDHNLAAHAKMAAKEKIAAVKHAVKPQAKVVKMSLCSVAFLALAVKTVALVLFYYVFSIGLTFYNKRFVKVRTYEPRREKTGLQGFRPGLTRTGLYSYRRWLEAGNFGFRKNMNCTICLAKTKALISCAVTAQLICAFVFA